jgi:GTP-binding protein
MGLEAFDIGDTIADLENPEGLTPIKVDEPTMSMLFTINTSPFFGKEGEFVTSRHLRDRLYKEIEKNLAMKIEETGSPDKLLVYGRGILHLGILVETMRREGYEFQVSQPQVIFRTIDGTPHEPFETLVMDVPEASVGSCIEKLGVRKGEMQNMETSNDGRTQLEFVVPSRGLIGFRGEFIRATRGEGIMSHSFLDYRPMQGDFDTRRNGVLIAFEEGTATFYALKNAEDRGQFFISPGTKVYKGMIVGENNRPQDLEINVCKAKQLTNMRSAGAEELDTLQAPLQMTLERALEYIGPDEMLEVTPESIRLRKLPAKKPARR